MKKYDVFRSEGGYRVCLAVYLDSPVMDYSPWFETEKEAVEAAELEKFKNETRDIGMYKNGTDWVVSFGDGCYRYFEKKSKAQEELIKTVQDLGYSREYIIKNKTCLTN